MILLILHFCMFATGIICISWYDVQSGSSCKRVPGVVEVVEPEFEILHVAEAIGLALHAFDFVVETFQRPIGYFVGVIPKQSLHAGQHR